MVGGGGNAGAAFEAYRARRVVLEQEFAVGSVVGVLCGVFSAHRVLSVAGDVRSRA